MGTRPIDRRRFVQLTGTALAVALAGCAEDGDVSGPGNETNGNATGTSPMNDTATGNETAGDTTEDTTTEEPTAFLRAVHAVADASAVDVTVAESGEALFSALSFGDGTDYEPVPGGDYTLEVRPDTVDNDGEVVAELDVSVEGGTAYSAFATGYVDPSGEQPALDLLAAVDGRTGGGES